MTESIQELNNGSNGPIDTEVAPEVLQAIKQIRGSQIITGDLMKATLELPPPNRFDNEILALALEKILAKQFRVVFPSREKMLVKSGVSIEFLDTQTIDLPPRKITIMLNPGGRFLTIEGKSPKHGRNGYTELFFEWQPKPGMLDARGNIDLKKINALPLVHKDDKLVTIYVRTLGTPGVTCFGQRIKQRIGEKLRTKWDGRSVYHIVDPDDETVYHLYAKIAGIVNFGLLEKDNPRTLFKLKVTDTVTINGDVDYTIGDQGSVDNPEMECTANLVIKGNVRGVFSLQSNGFIEVSGEIEGKSVVAANVIANVISSGCSVVAENEITMSTIINASARAKKITLEKTAIASDISAETLFLVRNAALSGARINTNRLESVMNAFSGTNQITLGNELFCMAKKLLVQIALSRKQQMDFEALLGKEAVAVMAEFPLLANIIEKTQTEQSRKILKMLYGVKQALQAEFKKNEAPVSAVTVHTFTELLDIMGDSGFEESSRRKVDAVINRIKKYNELHAGYVETTKAKRQHVVAFRNLKNQIQHNLVANFKMPKLTGNNAELRIHCGNHEMIIGPDEIRDELCIKYMFYADSDNLNDGELLIVDGLDDVENF